MKVLIGVAVLSMLLLAPSAGVAQTELPTGEARGVRVVRHEGAIVVVFTQQAAKLHRRLAGKRVIVSCTTMLDDGENIGSQVMKVPARGRRLFTGDLTRPIDYCRLWRPRGKSSSRRLLVSVPLTQKGAVFLDEESKTGFMYSVLVLAELAQEDVKLDRFPTYDEVVGSLPQRSREPFSKRVVPLAAPTDAPPAGKVGYYSDAQQVGVAIVSRSGRLLFIRYGPDEVLTTNVAGYIFNDPS